MMDFHILRLEAWAWDKDKAMKSKIKVQHINENGKVELDTTTGI